MHTTVKNLLDIETKINKRANIIAVSKTFKIDKILPLVDHGHSHFGENKVQEAVDKWTDIKNKNSKLNLHMIGKLQTNKVKFAVKLFDFIHSVDSEKLAKKIADEQLKIKRKIKIFIQVNVGEETQKSGININEANNLVIICKRLNLNVIGFMCIPPADIDPIGYFEEMDKINKINNFKQLSMGMSSDYIKAAKYNSTYLRIGSNIFGQRS